MTNRELDCALGAVMACHEYWAVIAAVGFPIMVILLLVAVQRR